MAHSLKVERLVGTLVGWRIGSLVRSSRVGVEEAGVGVWGTLGVEGWGWVQWGWGWRWARVSRR